MTPQLKAEIRNGEEGFGIYATLSYIPYNTMNVSLMYLFGGQQFDIYDGYEWGTTDLANGDKSLVQSFIGANEHPFTAY